MTVEIKKAVLRDASWITAYMREIDKQECFCQLPDDTPTSVLAAQFVHVGNCYIAYERDQPTMLFGTSPINAACFSVWGVGTERTPRVVPAVSQFMLDYEVPRRIGEGFRTAEARSIATHGQAHRWIESLGGVKHGPAFPYGKADEHFVLYRWTVAGYRAIAEKSRWSAR
jgi:hypothetical protein